MNERRLRKLLGQTPLQEYSAAASVPAGTAVVVPVDTLVDAAADLTRLAGQLADQPVLATTARLPRRDLEKLLDRCGFEPRPAVRASLFGGGWIVRAHVRPPQTFGSCSLIIPVYNELPFTRGCLESLDRTTPGVEIIVVNNGSTDGTREWLEGWVAAGADRVAIHHDTNQGFAGGCNAGLRAAQGEDMVLLNNDTLLTQSWLRRLLACLHSAPDVGLGGPMSNAVAGPQRVRRAYRTPERYDDFAWDWMLRHAGECAESTGTLIGFVLAIKRALRDDIGLLDERFGLGNCEDDDYCQRARRAGWRTLIARDCFVHHFGSRTLLGLGLDRRKLIADNQRLLADKYRQMADRQAQEEQG
ncbi:MAG: glycosyltransferase family 2 protein [Armatimonadetes bacterium]|nr:glycosyltransferase family 2 protein [Armatimonadota bacterium]